MQLFLGRAPVGGTCQNPAGILHYNGICIKALCAAAGTSAADMAELLLNVPQAPLPFLYASHGRSLLQVTYR
jgi:hypothetical protein